MDKDMGTKIKELRTRKGMTLEEVGNIVGVGKSTVRKWETGQIANMRRDKIASLANALGTTPAYLMGWKEEADEYIPEILPIRTKKFPVLGNIACGEPIFAEEQRDISVAGSADIRADFCLIAKGDSMTGARIYDGDIVFIRKQDTVEDGQIAAVLIDDEATLKRVKWDKSTNVLMLFPDNPTFQTKVYAGEELNNIRILGKVVASQTTFE